MVSVRRLHTVRVVLQAVRHVLTSQATVVTQVRQVTQVHHVHGSAMVGITVQTVRVVQPWALGTIVDRKTTADMRVPTGVQTLLRRVRPLLVRVNVCVRLECI